MRREEWRENISNVGFLPSSFLLPPSFLPFFPLSQVPGAGAMTDLSEATREVRLPGVNRRIRRGPPALHLRPTTTTDHEDDSTFPTPVVQVRRRGTHHVVCMRVVVIQIMPTRRYRRYYHSLEHALPPSPLTWKSSSPRRRPHSAASPLRSSSAERPLLPSTSNRWNMSSNFALCVSRPSSPAACLSTPWMASITR